MSLWPATADGTALPTDKRFLAAVHSDSVVNGTVVTVCEAPPPVLEFTTALNRINSHMLFPSVIVGL